MIANDEAARDIELLHSKVRALLNDTVPENLIIEELLREGHTEYYAQTIIDNIHKEKSNRKSFNITLLMGLAITISGLLINIISYNTATENNSMFFYVFWGIVAVGISIILRAFILYRK